MFQKTFSAVGHFALEGAKNIYKAYYTPLEFSITKHSYFRAGGEESAVRAAMDEWEKHTCVKFRYKTGAEKRYILVRTKMDSNGKPINVYGFCICAALIDQSAFWLAQAFFFIDLHACAHIHSIILHSKTSMMLCSAHTGKLSCDEGVILHLDSR